MIFNKYVFIVCSTSVCKAIRTERKIEKKIKAYFLKTVLLFFHSLLVLSLLFEFRVCVFFFFVFLSQVLLQWNQSLNRCLKQDVKNNTEKIKSFSWEWLFVLFLGWRLLMPRWQPSVWNQATFSTAWQLLSRLTLLSSRKFLKVRSSFRCTLAELFSCFYWRLTSVYLLTILNG